MSHAAQALSHRSHRRHKRGLWLALILIIWLGTWLAASYHLNTRIDNWTKQAAKEKIIFSFTERYTDGNPWMVHIHLKNFVFKHPKGHRLEADEVVLHLPLWNWTKLSAKFKGLIRGQIDQLSFVTEALKLGMTSYEANSFKEVSMKIHARAIGLTPHISYDPTLGRRIDELTFDVNLLGPSPSFNKREDIQVWSSKGGAFEFERLALSWGPLRFLAIGSLALKEDLQPEGVFSGRIKGLVGTLALCQEQGCLSPMEERMLKVSLNVLSRPSSLTGNTSPIIPLTLQKGGLYIGPVKITDIPKINW